ncbi:MAG: phosphatidylserine decarboxylase [Thermoplasmata archaeon]
MIAKGAGNWIVIPLVMGVVSLILSMQLASYVVYILANVFFLASVLVMILFRDPPRNTGRGVVSPADGKVVYVNTNRNSVSISTALHKVHVIRAPLGGKVLEIMESTQDRRAIETTIATEIGLIKVRQNPRLLPRKAIPYVGRRQRVAKGQRIGIVVPTGVVSVELPAKVNITVSEGQKVLAGETSVGRVLGAV